MKKISVIIAILAIVFIHTAQAQTGVPIPAQLTQKNNGTFPIVDSYDIKGGCVTGSDRNAFPDERRTRGMFFIDAETDSVFQLQGGLADENWTFVAVADINQSDVDRVAFYGTNGQITNSDRFKYNDTDGLTFINNIDINGYLNFTTTGLTGDIITMNNSRFLYADAYSNSTWGYRSGSNVFGIIDGLIGVTNCGSNNLRGTIDTLVNVAVIGNNNVTAISGYSYSLTDSQIIGSLDLGFVGMNSNKTYDHLTFIGNKIGNTLQTGSGNLIFIGDEMFYGAYTGEDTLIRNHIFIGSSEAGEGSIWDEIPFILDYNTATSRVNFNVDDIQLRGVSIFGTGLGGGLWTAPNDSTAQTTDGKYVGIGGLAYPGSLLSVWGDSYFNGTIYANDIITPTEIHWREDTVANIQVTTGNFDTVYANRIDGKTLTLAQSITATGAIKGINYTGALNTNQTLSTEIPSLTLTTMGREWATGALATQREVLITQPTYSFVGASTITNAATLGIAGAPIKSTNATIVNTHGLLIGAGDVSTATNSYGLTVNAQTGATNNYAAAFLGGNVGIGKATPQGLFHINPETGTGDLDNDSIFIVTSRGYVGIGKIIPNYPLDVNGNAYISNSLMVSLIQSNTLYPKDDADLNITTRAGGAGTKDIIFKTIGSTPTESMRLTSTGRLGIKTATPQNLFHINPETGTGDLDYDSTFIVTSGGRIGIGKISPTVALDVVGAGAFSTNITARQVGNIAKQTITLDVGATTFAVTSNVIQVTGDGGANTIATITGALPGIYVFIFVDALVTITDSDAHTSNTTDLAGTATNFTSADDKTLTLIYDGTSWLQIGTSTN